VGVKAAVCKSGAGDGCSTSFRVTEGGFYRWQLMVESGQEQRTHVPASITIPAPFAPTEVTGGGFVDVLAPTSRTFSWFPDPRNEWLAKDIDSAWIELLPPGSFSWSASHYPRLGPEASFTVPESALKESGQVVYGVRDCHLPPNSTTKFCSQSVKVGFYIGSDRFLGQNVVQTESGNDLEISFTNKSGNVRLLSSATLVPIQGELPIAVTTGPGYTVDGSLLTPGMHKIELVSCNWQTQTCSNRKNARKIDKAGVLHQQRSRYYHQGDVIAVLTPEDGSAAQSVVAPATGVVYFESTATDSSTDAGALVAYVITAPGDSLYILVDSPVEWVMERDYTNDFYPGVAHTVLGGGQALDIAYDTLGGIWLLNEFSNNIEHVTPSGHVESLTVPLARDTLSTPFAAVNPFALEVGNQNTVPVAISSLAERVTSTGSKMWFTQGGGLLENPADKKNHSRVISYDPLLSDSPSTSYDDRLCVYNIPSDKPKGFGNNQVIGLTAAGGRIWIGESRGLLDNTTSSLSSFIANPNLCENLLNFEDPEALANQRLQYCGPGRTPEQDGCMEKLLLDALPPGIKVAHLEADPVDNSVWFTDAHGKYLGNLNPDRNNDIKVYRFPDTHSNPFDGMPGFGGFAWSLRVDNSAVYLAEYATQHILRFDKASAVFSEIHIPRTTSQVTLHSIDIDPRTDRLWFTLSNEVQVPQETTASTIGYIDLASWRDHIADPVRTNTISAVLYRGLDSIPASKNRPNAHQSFRGIAIDQKSGKIAIATMWREQITELTPNPGFWP
jgi:streptogramin lyase